MCFGGWLARRQLRGDFGAGLCTRRSRLRAKLDEKVRWVNVDLPPVAAVRRTYGPSVLKKVG